MPVSAETLRVLMAKGLTGDDLLEVVSAIDADMSGGIPVDKTAEKRRAYDRERKARQRTSTGNSTGIPPDSNSASLRELELEPETKPRERRGKRIPPDWMPTEEHVAYGAKLGFTAIQYDREVEKFRNHWLAACGAGAVKLDWGRAFTNWLLRGSERLPSNAKPVSIAAPTTTAAHAWVRRGSEQWAAWARFRGKEPVPTFKGSEEGQYFRSEWPPPVDSPATA